MMNLKHFFKMTYLKQFLVIGMMHLSLTAFAFSNVVKNDTTIILKGWPKDGLFIVESLAMQYSDDYLAINDVVFLSGSNKIYWKQTCDALMIFVKGDKPQKRDFSFRLSFEKWDDPSAQKRRKFATLLTGRPLSVPRDIPADWADLVFGGQFMDIIEPMPAQGELSSNVWGTDKVKPRYTDNGIEDPEWTYWGGNAMLGKDSKYHLITCRWPEHSPRGHWHYKESLVVHAISDNKFGPYKVVNTLFPGHNPVLMQAKDGRFILKNGHSLYFEMDEEQNPTVLEPIEGIGKYWKEVPMVFDARERMAREIAPMGFTEREDGSWLMLTRHGDIWVSQTGESAFNRLTEFQVYPEIEGRFEDPVLWKTDVQYHLITNDWQGKLAYHMRSKDGVHWKLDPGIAYAPGIARLKDGTVNDWDKFEVIRFMYDEHGRPEVVIFAALNGEKNEDLGNDEHNSKNIFIPLTKEKLLTMMNEEPISLLTKEIRVRIQKEKDFNPLTDIDFMSLRFGASEEVNYGRGCKLLRTETFGEDLILVFDARGNGITQDNFAGKLIGRTKNGELLYGYTRLPGVDYMEPLLSALPPRFTAIKDGVKVEVEVQNFGQVASDPTPIKVTTGERNLEVILGEIPALQPYEKTTVVMTRMKNRSQYKTGSKVKAVVQIGEMVSSRLIREVEIMP